MFCTIIKVYYENPWHFVSPNTKFKVGSKNLLFYIENTAVKYYCILFFIYIKL